MLTNSQLAELRRSLRAQSVLSVYIDGTTTDPAVQRAWRVNLDSDLRVARATIDAASHAELAQFDACVKWLDREVTPFTASMGAPGFVAFVTSEGVQHAERLPVAVPSSVLWGRGMQVAPYTLALKELRPVVVAVADARTARLFRYHLGELTHLESLTAKHAGEAPIHMGNAPQQGFHTGTRGSTGRDATQRSAVVKRDQMLAKSVEQLVLQAENGAWILLGGIPRVVARLERMLKPLTPEGVVHAAVIDVHATEADIALAARAASNTLWEQFELERLSALIERADAGGLAVVDMVDTRAALDSKCVGELYFTPRFLERHVADAEHDVRDALDQGAVVEEVSGDAARVLDARGGIAAGLRFRADKLPRNVVAAPTDELAKV